MTRANGWEGWEKSTSEWGGYARGSDVGISGRAVLPEKKVYSGLWPRWVEVI